MDNNSAMMVDAIFDVSGKTPAPGYHFSLWESLVSLLPVLETDQSIGVIPLRTSSSAAGMLLPKRAKMTLRLPSNIAEQATQLCGMQLDIDDGKLQLGNLKFRTIQAYPTLHAHLVNSDEDEVSFIQGVSARLAELGVDAKLICGLRNHWVSPMRTLSGFSLVTHDLKPDASLQLQYCGLGAERRYGCGIFVPYKVISDLD